MMNGSFLMFCVVFYFDFSEFVDMISFCVICSASFSIWKYIFLLNMIAQHSYSYQ